MRTRLIVSIVFLIPLFYIGMGHMLGWPLPGVFTDHTHSMTLALTELVLLIPIVYVNDAYFINGFKSLVHGVPTMDAPIAVGATGFHCLVALRHVYHGRPAGRRANPRGHDDEHGQPVF